MGIFGPTVLLIPIVLNLPALTLGVHASNLKVATSSTSTRSLSCVLSDRGLELPHVGDEDEAES